MKKLILGIIAMSFILIATNGHTQTTKVLFISPDYQTGPKYDKIRSEISTGIRNCMQEKWSREISATTWDRAPSQSRLLENLRANYALRLDQLPVLKGTEKNIQISFELIYVDDAFRPSELTWNNSVYVVELNSRQEPTNIKNIVADVCDEIEFYLNSNTDPSLRKFRPHIKINGFDLSSGSAEDIDINAFGKWLNKILEDKYSVDPKYIFYYSRKYNKHYPDNSVYLITGTISRYSDSDEKLVKVELTIEFPDAYDVDPAIIHSREFSEDKKGKEELVNNIITVLEKNINYYGLE